MTRVRVPRIRVFFDIDGTLLNTDGAGRAALRSALELVYGTAGAIDGYSFHGKTDPQIVFELMGEAGLGTEAIRGRLPDMFATYLVGLKRELEVRIGTGRIRVLPGVKELLAELDGREDVALGLLTGNLEEGARLKLAAAGVEQVFDVGGYGSDAQARSVIAQIAVERCRARSGGPAATTVVVGDTPADVRCARAVGAHALAVATGRHSLEELERAGADAVFPDFQDTATVVNRILSFAGPIGVPWSAAGDGHRR